MGCSSTEEKPQSVQSNSKEFDYCFREDEITYIYKAKIERIEGKKNEEGEGGEEGGEEVEEEERPEIRTDVVCNIYKKIELDFSKQDKNLKEYLVLFIPDSYTQDTIKYDFSPIFQSLYSIEELDNVNKYIKYVKINNDTKKITKFEILPDPEIRNRHKCSIEFKLTPKDKEKKLVTIEGCYSIKPKPEYGLLYLTFRPSYEENDAEEITVCFTLDDNYMPCHLSKYYFDEISKYKLYGFNKSEVSLFLRDKRIKLKIENELDKGLLSKFTPDEIAQINNSLNTMEFHHNMVNLIYQKVIHNIKNKKNQTTIYDIVFYPNNGLSRTNSYEYEEDRPLIIKQFKINNNTLKKEKKKKNDNENYDDENNEIVDGYYVSDKKHLGFYYTFKGVFGLYEFVGESNDSLDYFRLNCNDLGDIDKNLIYGSAYNYEIILNGNKIKFFDKDFKYKIENGKIILKGIIDGNKDNFNQEKFVELAKKNDNERILESDDEEFKLGHWVEMRFKEFLPDKMKLI